MTIEHFILEEKKMHKGVPNIELISDPVDPLKQHTNIPGNTGFSASLYRHHGKTPIKNGNNEEHTSWMGFFIVNSKIKMYLEK